MNFLMGCIAVIFVNFISVLIMASRFKYLMALRKLKVNKRNAFHITIVSFIMNYLTPFKTGVFLGKPILVRSFSNANVFDSFLLTSVEVFLDLIWQLAIFIPLVILSGTNWGGNRMTNVVLLLVVLVIMIIGIKFAAPLLNICRRIRFFSFFLPKRYKDKLSSLDFQAIIKEVYSQFYHWKSLIFFFSITAGHIFIAPYALLLTAKIIGVKMAYFDFFILFWISAIIGRISMIPGGIGTREAAITSILYVKGINPIIGLKIAALARLLNIISVFIIGTPSLVYILRKFGARYFKRKESNESQSREGYEALNPTGDCQIPATIGKEIEK